MEDFLYFLSEYPIVAFLIIFFVARALFGGGEKGKQKRAEQRALQAQAKQEKREMAEAGSLAKKARAGDSLSGEGILAQIQRHLEEAARSAENEMRGQISSSSDLSLSRPEIRMSGPTDAESASLERADREDLFSEPTVRISDPVKESTIDYDLNSDSFAYHSATEASDKLVRSRTAVTPAVDAYAFNTASSKPADIAYSMNRRHYVSAARIEAPKVSIPENDNGRSVVVVRDLFSDSDSLTRAFILQEILGPPRGRRSGAPGRMRPQ